MSHYVVNGFLACAIYIFLFKQKTAYGMRIIDWSSDVCSSDLLFCVPVFRIMGRDYDAAVMGGGFIGFMLGTTANAMAVMRTLVLRYGMAPRAFLVAPLVGAFFIDFTNALIITGFLNFWP